MTTLLSTSPATGLVDAAPARTHLENLADAGVGLRTVAERSGVDRASLHRIRSGRVTTVRQSTLSAILSVEGTTRAAGAAVDATRTHQLVKELLAEGWTKARLAARIGHGARLRLGADRILVATADAVEQVWREHRGLAPLTAEPSGAPGRPDWEPLFEALAEIAGAQTAK